MRKSNIAPTDTREEIGFDYELSGPEGNAFEIIAHVSKYLVNHGSHDLANDFVERAFAARSYDELLRLAKMYAPIRFTWHFRPFHLVCV